MSSRDFLKALRQRFNAAPFTTETSASILNLVDAFLAGPAIQTGSDSAKILETLTDVYTAGYSSAFSYDWRACMIQVLARFTSDSDVITLKSVNATWWPKLLRPSLAIFESSDSRVAVNTSKPSVDSAQSILLKFITGDVAAEDEKAQDSLRSSILSLYVAGTAQLASNSASESQQTLLKMGVSNLEGLIFSFGKAKPKNFFAYIAKILQDSPEKRQPILSALVTFLGQYYDKVQSIPGTDLLERLFYVCLVDREPVAVSAALTSLCIILPHMAPSLPPHVPILYLIYARLAAELIVPTPTAVDENAQPSPTIPPLQLKTELNWTPLDLSTSGPTEVTALTNYFSTLYGLFPVTFLLFIRHPRHFLRDRDFDPPYQLPPHNESSNFLYRYDFLDWPRVRLVTEAILKQHCLIPGLIRSDEHHELAQIPEDNKWYRVRGSDIAVQCSLTRIPNNEPLPSSLAESTNSATKSTTQSHQRTPSRSLEDALASAFGSSFGSPSTNAPADRLTAQLLRENAVLRMQWEFESYTNQQYGQRMGSQLKERISAGTAEADVQALKNSMRHMRQQRDSALEEYARSRKETASLTLRHQTSLREMQDRVRAYKDDKKASEAQTAQLTVELEKAKQTMAAMRKRIEELGNENFNLSAERKSQQPLLSSVHAKESRIERLKAMIEELEQTIQHAQQRNLKVENLQADLGRMEMRNVALNDEVASLQAQRLLKDEEIARLGEMLEQIKVHVTPKPTTANEKTVPRSEYDNLQRKLVQLQEENIMLRETRELNGI